MADLFTAAEFKAHYGISTTTWDDWLATLATQMTARIARYCNRNSFDSTAYTDDLDGTGTAFLVLPNIPVTTVSSVSVDQGREFTETMSSDDYVIELESGVLEILPERFTTQLFSIAGEWPIGQKNIRVIYTAGYESIPSDLKLAAIEWGAAVFNKRRHLGITSQTVGGMTTLFESASIPRTVVETLAPFRRHPTLGGVL